MFDQLTHVMILSESDNHSGTTQPNLMLKFGVNYDAFTGVINGFSKCRKYIELFNNRMTLAQIVPQY